MVIAYILSNGIDLCIWGVKRVYGGVKYVIYGEDNEMRKELESIKMTLLRLEEKVE